MRNFRTLFPFFKTHWRRYALGILWVIIVDLLQLVIPRLLGYFIDALQAKRLHPREIAGYIILVLVVSGALAGFRFLWRLYINGTSRLLEYDLRNRLYQHLLLLAPSFYDHHRVGDLMAHATNDVLAVRRAMGMGFVMLIDAVLISVTTLAMMISMVPLPLTLAAVTPMPLIALVIARFGGVIHRRFRGVQEAYSHLTEHVQENISGIRVVKAFAQEQGEQVQFDQANTANLEQNMRLVRIWGLFGPLVQLLSGLSLLVALSYGGLLVLEDRISLGDFVAFNSYLMLLTWPMMAIGWVVNVMQRGSASMGRINTLLQEPVPRQDTDCGSPVTTVEGKIELRNLTFSYNPSQEPVLRNLSLVVEPGQTLALVGHTGSGKSTLARLLLRMYATPPGQLLVDGIDLSLIPMQTLRDNTGYVPQDSLLFSTTIADNIAFAAPASQQAIQAVAAAAHLDQDVQEFPHGYATLVGERGITLSGGQKQRVAIARALLKQPQILILDDCLSAVDTATEAAILQNLRQLRQGSTTVIIAHRLSTIQDADLIVVLDHGVARERGTHQSLLANQGLYYRIYQQQSLEAMIANS